MDGVESGATVQLASCSAVQPHYRDKSAMPARADVSPAARSAEGGPALVLRAGHKELRSAALGG